MIASRTATRQPRNAALALLSVVGLFAASSARAQEVAIAARPLTPSLATVAPVEPVDLAVMGRIREEGLTRSQLPQTLMYLTDVVGPRLTGSTGLVRANDWVKGKLTEWGLANARLEPWGPFGQGWTLERFSAQAVSPDCIPLIAFPKAWSPGWNGVKTAEAVYLDATDEAGLEKHRGKLKGKFVLVGAVREVPTGLKDPEGRRWSDDELAGMAGAQPAGGGRPGGGRPGGPPPGPAQNFLAKRWQFLLSEGVAGVLDPARGEDGTVFVQQASVVPPENAEPGQRLAPYAKGAEKRIVPQFAVAVEHYNRLVRLAEAGKKVEIAIEFKARFESPKGGMVDNVVAEIPGTDKANEVVMCGGHIDSWQGGTGATDNAAGVTVCMEAVRILKTLGLQPRRTIRIAVWSGEEQGLFGSRAYVEQHLGKVGALKPEGEKLAGYFNLDNGTGKIRGVYCQGNQAIMPVFAAWLEPFKDLGATTVTIRNTGGTDHLPFDAAGIPGFQFIQDPIDYNTRTHHSNQDVYDRIQTDDLKQAAVIMAAFLYNAATRDEMLPRKN
jgi:carboxypeptidase Q